MEHLGSLEHHVHEPVSRWAQHVIMVTGAGQGGLAAEHPQHWGWLCNYPDRTHV